MTLAEPRVETEPRVHSWTRDEYRRMGEAGLFDGRRVELIEGQVLEMSPINRRHVLAVILASDLMRTVFGAGWHVQVQSPLDLGELSEPEPDVAVISGAARDYTAHPTTAALVIEVADTSVRYDQHEKASLYAKAGIPDYWLLNLQDRRLEVRRKPIADPGQPFGFTYSHVMILLPDDTVAPLAKPDAVVRVADLLP